MASSYKKVITLGLDYSDFQGGVSACNAEMKKLIETDRNSQKLTETHRNSKNLIETHRNT